MVFRKGYNNRFITLPYYYLLVCSWYNIMNFICYNIKMKLSTVTIISTINFSVTEGLHFLWYLNKNILFVFQKLLLIIEVLHLGLIRACYSNWIKSTYCDCKVFFYSKTTIFFGDKISKFLYVYIVKKLKKAFNF